MCQHSFFGVSQTNMEKPEMQVNIAYEGHPDKSRL